MNLKCVFHVSPGIRSPEQPAVRSRMPSLLDLDVEWEEQPAAPRGTSYETWQRARGWSSED